MGKRLPYIVLSKLIPVWTYDMGTTMKLPRARTIHEMPCSAMQKDMAAASPHL